MIAQSKFTPEGIRETYISFKPQHIDMLRKNMREYVGKLPAYNGGFDGRGIVICAGGYRYFTCCWILVNTLRRENNCTLPIQVWYNGDEMKPELIDALRALDVMCFNISDYMETNIDGYAMKPMAILLSSFKEVLYLDADIICTSNPELLFELPEYNDNGALFWPDFWETDVDNSVWSIIETAPIKMKEQESGQILIDKERCWKELILATYFNVHNNIFYHVIHGDKDTFRFAWMALKTPFYMIETEPSECGYTDSDNLFIGHTMVQHLPGGKSIFLHRNLLKWYHTDHNDVEKWQVIKRFKTDAKQKKYYIDAYNSVHKHGSMNIEGDVEILNFKEIIGGDIEVGCLKYLRELREADWYIKSFREHLGRFI